MKFFYSIIFLILLMVFPHQAYAQMDSLFKNLKSSVQSQLKTTKLSDTKIGQGLKEALKIGINNAVKLTGALDGYLKNEQIKIPVPENLKMLDKGLRTIGLGAKMDEFILSMNRSAEKAAPLAQNIFLDALLAMNFEDAQKILKGAPSAATDYFKEKTSSNLKSLFLPEIQRSMSQYAVTRQYNEVIKAYRQIPFSKNFPALDIEHYVLTKALDGLFLILAQEEQKIRTNPQARVTDLLKEVFK